MGKWSKESKSLENFTSAWSPMGTVLRKLMSFLLRHFHEGIYFHWLARYKYFMGQMITMKEVLQSITAPFGLIYNCFLIGQFAKIFFLPLTKEETHPLPHHCPCINCLYNLFLINKTVQVITCSSEDHWYQPIICRTIFINITHFNKNFINVFIQYL